MKINDFITEAEKVRLDPKCWTGKKIGNPKTKVKGGVRVNNCVPAESVNEMDKSQTPPGRSGASPDSGKEYTAKPIKAKDFAKDAGDQWTKNLSKDQLDAIAGPRYKKKGVAEGLNDTQKKIEDTINKLEDRLKHAKTDEQWDNIKNRIERLQAGLKRSKQGVVEVSKGTLDRYVPAAVTAHGHADFGARMSKDDPTKRSYHKDQLRTAEKRRQGISRALDRMSKNEGMAEDYNPEYDDEAGMADNNLETLARAVEGIDDVISAGDNLPEWCQEKIAVAKSMLVAVWDYMKSEENIEQGLAEGPGFDKWADDRVASQLHKLKPGMVQDRKTGKWYDPNKEFEKKMNSPEVMAQMKRMAQKEDVSEGICSIQEANAIFDDFERSVEARGLTEDIFDTITDEQIIAETAAWRRKEGKSKKGGLNAKGVASYRRENPGSKLQMAVTTKPSKLKPGSKAAKRRKSFCARMSGVKGPMKKPNGKPTRKALALRKWNC